MYRKTVLGFLIAALFAFVSPPAAAQFSRPTLQPRVTAVSNLPTCNAERRDFLVYVVNEGQLYRCDGTSAWSSPASVGVGAKNGAAVSVVEQGDGAVHKTVFTLTALSVVMTDATTAGSHGSHKLYDFPAGAIQALGCSYDLTTLAGAGGITDTAALVGAIGSAAVLTDNATLTSTEADIIASTVGTLTAGAGALASHASLVATAFDGTTTAVDYYLNLAVPDADSSANDTVAVSGTITCVWSNLGDY